MESTTKRRALVVAATTSDLPGTARDAQRVAAALQGREFSVELCCGPDASRDGILAALQRLRDVSNRGDAAVIYYAGHGGRAINADPRAGDPRYPEVPRAARFIVPTDYHNGTGDDFRGITAWELSLALSELTARTDNVTTVFDCCHAADLTRSAGDHKRARSLPHAPRVELSRRLDALHRRAQQRGPLDAMANPMAVRFFACGEDELAWEHRRLDGDDGGVFTEALLDVLAACAADATWDSIAHAVRERVRMRVPSQRPVLGGPVKRTLFSLEEPAACPWLPVIMMRDGVPGLEIGRLSGLQPGDQLTVMPPGFTAADDRRRVARATVVCTHSLVSELALEPPIEHMPPGALGFLDPASAPPAIANRLAVASEASDGIPPEAMEVTWGTTFEDRSVALPSRGATLGRDDRFYVQVANRWDGRFFVHVLMAGDGRLASLTRVRSTTGQLVEPGQTLTLGAAEGNGLVGLALPRWDDATPTGARSLLVIATSEPADLGFLTAGASTIIEREPPLAQVVTTDTRHVILPVKAHGFLVVRRTFVADGSPPQRVGVEHAAKAGTTSAPAPTSTPGCAATIAVRVAPATGKLAAIGNVSPIMANVVPFDRDQLTLLYVTADPGGTRSIAVARECRSIEREIALGGGHHTAFHPRLGATIDDLLRFLRELSPCVLHFSGHAAANDGFAFEDEMGGWRWVSPVVLATALRASRSDLSVLFLSACHGNQLIDALGSTARCVIGMRGAIADQSARAFSVGFYRALSVGDTVAQAIDQGCAQVALDGAPGFAGLDVLVQDGVVLDKLRLVRGSRPAAYGLVNHTATPSETELDALARLVDLETLLTASERIAVGSPTVEPRGLVALLRRLAILLGRTRTRVTTGAPEQVDAMLATVTGRLDVRRGVLCPVVVAHDRDVADVCRRAVAFDLDVWIESHRSLLAQASIPILRAPVTVEFDPTAVVSPLVCEALAGHAVVMQDLAFRLRLEHLGDDDQVDAEELLPVPGTLVLDRVVLPVPTSNRVLVRVSTRARVLLEFPSERARTTAVPTADLPTGCRLDWEVITRDIFGREECCAAGWFRVATPDDRVALDRAEDAAARFRLGAWDDVIRRLWPRVRDASLDDHEYQMLVQLVRHEHEWLTHCCPRWNRLDRCGRALSLLDH